MITSQETTNLLKAMIEAAPEISSIGKTKQAYGYKYATLDSLIDMLRGVLPKHGLWFTQMPTRSGDLSVLTTRVFHTSGEWLEDSIQMTDTELQGKANDTQKIGASITYYRRYALSAIFGVSADEDVDGNLANAQPAQRATAKPAMQNAQDVKKWAIEIIKGDYAERQSAGKSNEDILRDYADLLKTDTVRPVKEMPSAEVVCLANTIKRMKESANVQ